MDNKPSQNIILNCKLYSKDIGYLICSFLWPKKILNIERIAIDYKIYDLLIDCIISDRNNAIKIISFNNILSIKSG